MACLIGLAIIWQELPSHSGKILIPWMLLSTALLYQPLQKGLNTLRGEAYRKDNFCYYMYYAFGVTLISFKYVGKE